MAISLRTSAAASAVRPARAASVKCQAGPSKALPAALATFAAASLISSPAFAGVILQQPELKKVFQEDASSAPAKKASAAVASAPATKDAPAPKAAPAPKKESYSEGGSFPNAILLVPASIGAIVGGGFVLTKVDPGFEEVFVAGLLKDSSTTGAGYEVALKGEGGVAALKVGTKKVRGGTTKKGRK